MMPDLRKIQKLIGATQDGVWGDESNRKLDEALALKFPVVDAAIIPDSYWATLAQIESGGQPYVKASTSSASGLYQFTKGTWLGEGGQWGSDLSLAFGGLKPSIDEQFVRAKTFTQKNADRLAKAGIPITKATLYAAHFLGASMAIKILGAPPSTPLVSVVSGDQIQANPSVLGGGKRVSDFLAWLNKKTSVST